MRRLFLAVLLVAAALSAQYRANSWWEPLSTEPFPGNGLYENSTGTLGIIHDGGSLEPAGHPFFTPLGTNGRACITCHQPSQGMSVTAAAMRERWTATGGKDPVFAAIDGSNCPDLPQELASSHSLLLERGLFRIPISWPPANAEFTIEVVRDPTGCNLSPAHGLKSTNPTVSVFRRPRPAANLRYITSGGQRILLKNGQLSDLDPDTGRPSAMNMMADAREPSLYTQARSAILGHQESRTEPTRAQLEQIVAFESALYMAQAQDHRVGKLNAPGLGPEAMRDSRAGVLGDNTYDPVFKLFDAWKVPAEDHRASIARGADIFLNRQFWLRDATHINSIGLGNPMKRTCATCHNAQMTGQDLSAGWVDVGTTNFPTWTEPATWNETSELPVFKITCSKDARPHPYLGRVIYTTDPGRALISGKCTDVGSIVMQQMRGLSARAPYFSNGSAKTLREVVDFYDRRFDMKLTDQEKDDLIAFLGAL